MKNLINWLAEAFVFFTIVCFVSLVMFWLILGSMERYKERQRKDFLIQYSINKVKCNLEEMGGLP